MQFAALLPEPEVLQDGSEELLSQDVLHNVPQTLTPQVWGLRNLGGQEPHRLFQLHNRQKCI